jgi:hypothetical protein
MTAGICVFTAYLDDSGTHDQSEAVVWAGVIGNQYQWEYFDELWAAKLKDPCPGKDAITCFHMYDCEYGENEFLYWKRHEREYLVSELIEIINKCGLWGVSAACVRKDWDELVNGELRKRKGDAEVHCIKSCYQLIIELVTHKAYDKQLAFVFDNRPHKSSDNQAIYELFDDFQKVQAHEFRYNVIAQAIGPFRGPPHPELVSLTFASVKKFRALQAADLFAFESYHGALSSIRTGSDDAVRKNLKKLIKTGRFARVITTRKEILNLPSLSND